MGFGYELVSLTCAYVNRLHRLLLCACVSDSKTDTVLYICLSGQDVMPHTLSPASQPTGRNQWPRQSQNTPTCKSRQSRGRNDASVGKSRALFFCGRDGWLFSVKFKGVTYILNQFGTLIFCLVCGFHKHLDLVSTEGFRAKLAGSLRGSAAFNLWFWRWRSTSILISPLFGLPE